MTQLLTDAEVLALGPPAGPQLLSDEEVLALGPPAASPPATAPTEVSAAPEAGFTESIGRGVDIAQGLGYSFLEATGEAADLGALTEFGREGRERNIREADAYGPRARLSGIEGFGDFFQWVKETVGEQIPIMAPSLAGAGAGALLMAPVPIPGARVIGAAIGAFVPSFALGVGETQQAIKERGGTAPGAAFIGGSAIGALDTILPGKIGSALVRKLGRDAAEEVAKRTLMKRVAVEGGKGMAIEGLTEAMQEAIGEVAAATGTGTEIDKESLKEQMVEAGAAGVLMGGLVGGGAGTVSTQPQKSSTQRLKDLMDDPRSVDEIRTEDEAKAKAERLAAAQRANEERQVAEEVHQAARTELGIPPTGARVTVTIPSGEIFAGTVGNADADEDGAYFKVETPDGEILEFDVGAVQISAAEEEMSQKSPVIEEIAEDIDVAAAQADPNPTDAMKESGNYRKGHVQIHGLDISIENAKGSTRSGVGKDGQPWEVQMFAHYGYFKRTDGADGDQVDVYVGSQPENKTAYVVDQYDPETGEFDEHKVILGAPNADAALGLYDVHFSDDSGPSRRGTVTEMSIDEFKGWLRDGDTTKPVAAAPGAFASPVEPAATPQAEDSAPSPGATIPEESTEGWEGSLNGARQFVLQKDGGKVTPRMLMRQLGITDAIAKRLIDHMRAQGNLTRSGYARRHRTKPRDVLDIIREMGGIQADGDIDAMDLRKARPGLVVGEAKGGKTAGAVAEHLSELGILPEGYYDSDVYDLIRGALFKEPGRPFHPQDQDLVFEQQARDEEDQRQDVEDRIKDIGVNLSKDELDSAVSLVGQGAMPEDAVEQVVVRSTLSDLEEYPEHLPGDYDMIPFDEVADETVEQEQLRGDVEVAAEGGSASERARETEEEFAEERQEPVRPGEVQGQAADDDLLEIPTFLQRSAEPIEAPAGPQAAPTGPEGATPPPAAPKRRGNIEAIQEARFKNVVDEIYVQADELGIDLPEEKLEGLARRHIDDKVPIKKLLGELQAPAPEAGISDSGPAEEAASALDQGYESGSFNENPHIPSSNNSDEYIIGAIFKNRGEPKPEIRKSRGHQWDINGVKYRLNGNELEPVEKPKKSEPIGDVRDKEIGEVIGTDERAAPRDEERDRRELKARRAGKKRSAKEQKEADEGLFAERETPLERAIEDKESKFSREENSQSVAGRPPTKEQLSPIIARITARWRNPDTIRVVDGFSDLPATIQQDARDQGGDYRNEIKGVFHDGVIYIIPENHTSLADVEATLLHEAYGHGGLAALFGGRRKRAMSALYQSVGGREGIHEIAGQHGIDLSAHERAFEQAGLDERDANQRLTEELLAKLASINKPGVKRALKEFFGAIRMWLRARGFMNLAKYSDSDLIYILRRARKALERGGTATDGETLFNRKEPRLGEEPLNILPDSAAREREKQPREEQEQGAFSNTFAFESRRIRDFIFDGNMTALERIRRLTEGGGESVLADDLRVKFQDKFLAVKRTQEEVSKVMGRAVGENEDAYLAEELYYGRTGKRLEDFQRDHVEPLIEAINKEGVSLEDVQLFLYARHATERNAQIASINPEMKDGGSGMTNTDAKEIVDGFRNSGSFDALERIAGRIDAIVAEANQMRLEGGLIDSRTLKRWTDTYEHYVPLRGFEHGDEVAADAANKRGQSGKGFDIRGQESKRALGRESRAGDILAHVLSQYEEALIRAERNKVGKAFLKLAQQNPDPALWEIDERPYQRAIDKTTGLVVWRPDPLHQNKENVLAVKVGGKVHYITIHHAKLARAMKNLGAENTHWVVQMIGSLNRYFAFINTSLNPEFVISNFLRDIQTAGINLQQFEVEKLTRQVMRDVSKALSGAYGGIKGKKETEWQKHFQEYADEGGKIAFFGLEDIATRQRKIEALMKNIDPSVPRKALLAGRAIKDFIGDVNGAVENAVRLSTYVNLRKAGVSKAKAASIARNLTVNFNKKGEYGAFVNAFYLFYNASIQGSAVVIRALGHKRVRKLVGGIVLFNVGLELLNAAVSGGDDDERLWYDKITPWTKDHNLIVVNPLATKESEIVGIKIPLPYGYNVFHVLGRKIGEMIRRGSDDVLGEEIGRALGAEEVNLATPGQAAIDVALSIVDSFNPLGTSPTFSQFATPTFFKPFVQISENKNFMGIPIYPQDVPYQKAPPPDSERYFRSASRTSVTVAKKINDLTGGNEARPGKIFEDDARPDSGIDTSISPETMDHFFDFFTGGAGMFVRRSTDFVARKFSGDEIEWREVPFVRKVIEGKNRWADYERYRAIEEMSARAVGEQKKLRDKGKKDEARKQRDRYRLDLVMKQPLKSAERMLKKLRKERRRADRIEDDTKKRERVEAIEDRMQSIMRKIIRTYNVTRKCGPLPSRWRTFTSSRSRLGFHSSTASTP